MLVAYDVERRSGEFNVFDRGSEWHMLFGPDAGSNPQASDIRVALVKMGLGIEAERYVVAQDLTATNLFRCIDGKDARNGQGVMEFVTSFPR